MLYSHQHKFIFIKTLKTAGTSLEMCLSRHLTDSRDIITPISFEDEKIRNAEGVLPRNYHGPDIKEPQPNERTYFWAHMHARMIHARLPREFWENAIKVTSERHPYEKAVSLAYFYFAQNQGKIDFSGALEFTIGRGRISNMNAYSLNGKIIADVIIRYEHLLEDTNRFLASLGLPAITELPKAKTRYRLDKRPGAEILSAEQKRKVQEVCAREFEYFGYQK